MNYPKVFTIPMFPFPMPVNGQFCSTYLLKLNDFSNDCEKLLAPSTLAVLKQAISI